MSLSWFFRGLLADPAPPAALQRRVFDFGVRTDNPELLATLAAVPGLDPEIDAALGELPLAKVRAVWVSRPGRDPQIVHDLLAAERRVGVLAAFAELGSLPEQVYHQLAEHKSAKVTLAVATNPLAPLAARRVAAAAWGASLPDSVGWKQYQLIEQWFKRTPELHDALASRASCAQLFVAVLPTPGLSQATMANINGQVQRFMVEYNEAHTASRWAYNPKKPGLSELERVISALTDSPNPLPRADLLRLMASWSVAPGLNDSYRDRALAKLQAAVRRIDQQGGVPQAAVPAGDVDALVARSTDDPAVLSALAEKALRSGDAALALAVAGNRAASADLVHRLLQVLPYDTVAALLKLRARDLGVVVALVLRDPRLLSDDVLAATGDPVRALNALASAFASKGYLLPAAVTGSIYATEDLAAALPPTYLAAANLPLTVRRAAARLLLDQLGDSDSRWQLFCSLGEEFTGGLGDLLDAASLLADDQRAEPAPAAQGDAVEVSTEVSTEAGSDEAAA